MEVGSGEYVTKPVYDVPKNWGKEITGRRVDFGKPGEGEGLAWGIEVSIPVDSKIRDDMKKAGILLPEHVTEIDFLDMRPQESLPKKLRNIESNHKESVVTSLEKIVETSVIDNDTMPFDDLINRHRPSRTLTRILDSVFVFNKDKIDEFNNNLQNSKGNKLVIVEGHGGGDPLEIGEYDWQQTVDSDGNIIQKMRNAADIDKILDKYDQPTEVAAVVFRACNSKKAEINPRKVMFVHTSGLTGYNKIGSLYRGVKTVVVPPIK